MKITQTWFKKEIEITTEELEYLIYRHKIDGFNDAGFYILKFIQKLGK